MSIPKRNYLGTDTGKFPSPSIWSNCAPAYDETAGDHLYLNFLDPQDFTTTKGWTLTQATNGTAVLGLGNIGALAGKPVMEGKSMLFKTFADIDAFDIEVDETDPLLNREMGAFVTLHEKGQLRGCIGNMVGRGPLCRTVAAMAIEAATGDPRFSRLSPAELDTVDIEVSVLTPPKKVRGPEEIREAEKIIDLCGGEISDVLHLDFEGIEGEGNLVIINKVRHTPREFPRAVGIPAKKPILTSEGRK